MKNIRLIQKGSETYVSPVASRIRSWEKFWNEGTIRWDMAENGYNPTSKSSTLFDVTEIRFLFWEAKNLLPRSAGSQQRCLRSFIAFDSSSKTIPCIPNDRAVNTFSSLSSTNIIWEGSTPVFLITCLKKPIFGFRSRAAALRADVYSGADSVAQRTYDVKTWSKSAHSSAVAFVVNIFQSGADMLDIA